MKPLIACMVVFKASYQRVKILKPAERKDMSINGV